MSKGLKINLVGGAIIDVEIRLTDLLKCASPLLSRKYISLMPKTSLKLRQVVTSINLENELTPVSLARLQTVA